MKANSYFARITMLLLILWLLIACDVSNTPASPAQQPSSTQLNQGKPNPTATLPPTNSIPTITIAQSTFTPPAGPNCTILQDLNLRSGPGTAYRPPIKSFPSNTIVIPLGYNPNGVPGGAWIFVQNPTNQEKGWISAGSQYVSCNIGLTTLPFKVADAQPPPAPLPHSAVSSTPDGDNCGPPYECKVIVSDDSLIQFILLKDGKELLGKNDGVQEVVFTIEDFDKTRTIYSKIEESAAYCIFSGDGPCNPWIVEDGVYKWTQGGEIVQEGTYYLNIDPLLLESDGSVIPVHWERYLQISLP